MISLSASAPTGSSRVYKQIDLSKYVGLNVVSCFFDSVKRWYSRLNLITNRKINNVQIASHANPAHWFGSERYVAKTDLSLLLIRLHQIDRIHFRLLPHGRYSFIIWLSLTHAKLVSVILTFRRLDSRRSIELCLINKFYRKAAFRLKIELWGHPNIKFNIPLDSIRGNKMMYMYDNNVPLF